MDKREWVIEYNNDTGPDDDCFVEWWEVTDGNVVFKTSRNKDAAWLLNLIIAYDAACAFIDCHAADPDITQEMRDSYERFVGYRKTLGAD